MTLADVLGKLRAFRPSGVDKPFTVRFRMRSNIALAHPWINMDGLITYFLMKDLLGDRFTDLPRDPIELEGNLMLPLKRSYTDRVHGGIYHASASLFDGRHMVDLEQGPNRVFSTVQYKRFHTGDLELLHTKKKLIPIDVGFFKAAMVKTPYISSNEVTFHLCGDRDLCGALLGEVTNLGKDRGRGFGEIAKMTLDDDTEDRSLWSDGIVNRPIPYECMPDGSVTPGDCVRAAYRPPYWQRSISLPCAPPGTRMYADRHHHCEPWPGASTGAPKPLPPVDYFVEASKL